MGRKRAATGSMSREQTCVSLVRLLVSVKVYGLCQAGGPQSTIMTRRITGKVLPLDGSTQRLSEPCLKSCPEKNFFFFVQCHRAEASGAGGENESPGLLKKFSLDSPSCQINSKLVRFIIIGPGSEVCPSEGFAVHTENLYLNGEGKCDWMQEVLN